MVAAILRKIVGARKLAPSVANGDSLPFVGPQPHSVAALKTPVALRKRAFYSRFLHRSSRALREPAPHLENCFNGLCTPFGSPVIGGQKRLVRMFKIQDSRFKHMESK